MFARFSNVGLAVWLLISCFAWPRNANPTLILALFIPALLMAFEAASFMDRRIRFASTAMGVVIVAQAFGVAHYLPWLRWHDAAIGGLVILFSLVPNRELSGSQLDLA